MKPVDPDKAADPRQHVDRENLAERIADATAFLEAIRDDYKALAQLPYAERQRFLMAAGQVARPGPWAKRELAAAARARQEAKRRSRDERLLEETGIRQSRRQRVFAPWHRGATIDRARGDLVAGHLFATETNESQSGSQDMPSDGPGRDEPHGAEPRLQEPVHCYVCKADFSEVHFFYDALCPSCAELNWNKRSPSADLRGRVAVVTGARVKIGFYAALMLLRAGAHVIVTTRFPRDAAERYAAEEDASQWLDRLEVFGLDLRHTPSVEAFAQFLNNDYQGEGLPRLDFLINNACQTVRRPVGFYDHLMEAEEKPTEQLGAGARQSLEAYEQMRGARQLADGKQLAEREPRHALVAAAGAMGLRDPAALSQLALLEEDLDRSTHLFPTGQLDADLQQVDLREVNSWRLPLADVSAVELLEVQLVNAVAPFILNARLKPLMLEVPTKDKHIVNVSAVEGQFSRRLKTDRHPHTNMAKAALNMMTRTSAADYLQDGIHMNSVDTGWITDEDPAAIAERKKLEQGFHPPLDIVDGAARIVDPIFTGIRTGKHTWGAFLKDYLPTDW